LESGIEDEREKVKKKEREKDEDIKEMLFKCARSLSLRLVLKTLTSRGNPCLLCFHSPPVILPYIT
jgi:hypothetical protein